MIISHRVMCSVDRHVPMIMSMIGWNLVSFVPFENRGGYSTFKDTDHNMIMLVAPSIDSDQELTYLGPDVSIVIYPLDHKTTITEICDYCERYNLRCVRTEIPDGVSLEISQIFTFAIQIME